MAAGESQQMLAGESERLLAGRYRLLAVIGRGGMGAVWRARDELLNRDVAVKEIVWPVQLDAEEREMARRRTVREAQLAARVRHPNVVGVYDIIEEGDRPSIVMELVPFRSLRDAVAEDGPMTPAEAARVGLSVLSALRAVHEVGVVHRDVKPANILLGPDGRVVLADFGIAKAADSPALTISGVLLGSPSYLAPERARGGRAGAAADMWALGAALFAAVEGHPPFEREGVVAVLGCAVGDVQPVRGRAGRILPVYQFDWFLDRRPARLADLARWSLRVYPGPGQQRHIPADRPVGSAQGQRAGGLAPAGGQPPGHVPRLPSHPAPVGPLSAGRAGRRLGIHLQQEWRHGPGAEPEHPCQRASCLRPLLVDACQRLERLLPLLPGLRGHVPARTGRPARLTAACATHKTGPREAAPSGSSRRGHSVLKDGLTVKRDKGSDSASSV